LGHECATGGRWWHRLAVGGEKQRGWDFFVSYTQTDRPWAEWIAWVLEEAGYRVLIQAWDFVPGANWIQGMQSGTSDADRTIAVLSPDYLESVYGGAEWQAAWAQDPEGIDRKLLTVRVSKCDRPGLLGGVVSADLFGLAEDAAKTRLLDTIEAALSGRAKPTEQPAFPGAGRAVPSEPRFPATLPGAWKVPARNPNFTGRGPELTDLARVLAVGSTVTVQAVRGMGGVGKTQLAIEYAHARACDYDVVWQIAAEEPAAIPDQFTALAAALGLEPATTPEALQAQMHSRLRATRNWLLIFDNADTVDGVRPWLPGGPVSAGSRGHAIVTTRRGGFGAVGRVMDLDVIDLPDAVALLRARVPDLAQVTGERIAEELGRLPLALEQAAAYLERTRMSGEEYLDLLRTRAADLYERGQVASRTDTVASLWRISLDRIAGESPAAIQLLEICAFLAPEPIPLDLFTGHPDRLPEPLAFAVGDKIEFADVIGLLIDYSLAKRTSAGLQLHRLVQAAIRLRHDGLESRPQVGTSAPTAHPLAVAMALLSTDAPSKTAYDPQAWPRWATLLPHVLAAAAYLDHLRDQPSSALLTDASWLLDRAGSYLRVHGRSAAARPLMERALAIVEAIDERDLTVIGIRLNNLALILRDLGDASEARPLVERALAIHETTYGPDRPEVAIDLSNLALILQGIGDAGAARPLQERALAIDEATYGLDHPAVARDLNNLAVILQDLEGAGAARPLQERVLAIDQAVYGPDHPEVAVDLNNLAQILQSLGDLGGARPLQERALAISESTYGPEHPTVAVNLNNLAMISRDLGDLGRARPLQERALAIDEAAYGPNHPTVALRVNNLAVILRELGEAEEAGRLYERARAIQEAVRQRKEGLAGS
jgi:tetratricopeptide (TPR) repeat protein